jgi:uncharacterized protein
VCPKTRRTARIQDGERELTPLTGLTDVLRELGVYVSLSADMPVTFLLGISPAGLNATGESDTRSFYDRIDGERVTVDLPLIEKMFKLMFLSKDGPTKGKEPEDWSVLFNPMYQPTEKEQADTQAVIAQADQANIQNQVYTAAEARKRYQGDTFAVSIQVEGDLPDAPTEDDIIDIAAARAERAAKQPPKLAPPSGEPEATEEEEVPTDVKDKSGGE